MKQHKRRDFNHCFSHGSTAPSQPGSLNYPGFTITLRHTTLGGNPLDEWSVQRWELYLATHNTHNIHTYNTYIHTLHTYIHKYIHTHIHSYIHTQSANQHTHTLNFLFIKTYLKFLKTLLHVSVIRPSSGSL